MARYDGEIRFNTKIDEKGFNKGASNLGDKMKSIGSTIASVAAGAIAGFTVILTVISLLIRAITQFVGRLASGVNRVIGMGEKTQSLKEDFAELKTSVQNAFLPLLQFALPLLQRVAAWLTKIFNFIGMILGALTGQREVMRATADAASDAAGSTGKMAKNAEDAEKAAKGALASFDELNVLQMEEPEEETPGGGGGGAPGGGFEMVPIAEGILSFFDRLREKFAPIREALSGLWESLGGLWDATVKAFEPWFEWAEDQGILDFILDLATNGIEWLTEKIKELTVWIGENEAAWRIILVVLGAILLIVLALLFPIVQTVLIIGLVIAAILLLIKFWPVLKQAAIDAWEAITEWAAKALNNIGEFFTNLWNNITSWAAGVLITIADFFGRIYYGIVSALTNTWQFIKNLFTFVVNWIDTNVITPLIDGFKTVWDNIKTGFTTAWNAILSFFRNTINKMIDLINGLIRGIVSGLNAVIGGFNSISVTIPTWVPVFGGNTFGVNIPTVSAPQIPRLASGAVIPPNSEFLAVLGDQRTGRNIETPEDLMRQIVREELAGMVGGNEEINVTMPVYLDSEKIYEGQKRVERRRGSSLVTGGSIA